MFTAKTLLDRSPADIAFTLNANLASSMAMTIAAWPAFADQQYGRIVNISSASALGLLPAIDYSAGKAGIVGLTRSLAIAGPEAGVLVNAVMPIAFTRAADANMEGAALRDFAGKKLAPVLVAPIVAVLAHERCPVNGKTFSSAGGVVSSVDFCETAGHVFEDPTPEAILAGMDSILDQDGMTLAPTAHEQAASYMARLGWK
jgi:NAD(P)-dependent dehydrogenase (short-subunit alcohol dehydrogenase family)